MKARVSERFFTFGFNEPMPLPGATKRNGSYTGTGKLRELPPGVSGRDLERLGSRVPRSGQVWRRGDQRVRISRVTRNQVWFREITHGSALRHLDRGFFLRHAFPDSRWREADQ